MLVRQLDTSSDFGARDNGFRGLMAVQFFEKKRRKAWFSKGEEEVCWEQWTLDVTLATPRTESGMHFLPFTIRKHWKGRFLRRRRILTRVFHCNRESKSQKGNGSHASQSSHEDRHDRQPRKRSYPTHHHERGESVPLSDCR